MGIIRDITTKQPNCVNNEKDDTIKIYWNINYPGENGEQLIKDCAKKLKRFTTNRFIIVPLYSLTKMSFFTNMKDKLQSLSKSNVVYEFICPGCLSLYIGKTDCTLFKRTQEHAASANHTIKLHIDSYSNCEHLFSLHSLVDNDVDKREFYINLVRDHTTIIDKSENWNVLLFKDAFHIK